MKICIFLAFSLFRSISVPGSAFVLANAVPKPTLNEVMLAMDKKMMLDEFTGNWSLDTACVKSQSDRQLTLMSDHLDNWGTNTFIGDHLLVGDLNRMIFAFNHTKPFQDQMEKARDQCDFYMDHDLTLSYDHKKIAYFRLLFLVRPDQTYSIFHITLDIKYDQPLDQSVVDFLNCATLYGRRLDQCRDLVPKDRFSLDDFRVFYKWAGRAATTGFMSLAVGTYLSIIETLKNYAPLLPHTYRPKKKCDLWPDYRFRELPYSCDNIDDPTFSSALRLYETWILPSIFDHTTIRNAKRALIDDPRTPTCSVCSVRPMCSLSKPYLIKQMKQWLKQGSIDQWFYNILYQNAFNWTSSRDQPYFLRESFNMTPTDNTTMHYMRALVYSDPKKQDVYHVAMVSYKATTKEPLIIRVTPEKTCDEPNSVKCSYDMVQTQKFDDDVKKYMRYSAKNNIPE